MSLIGSHMFSNKQTLVRRFSLRGFSLVELLVSISIIVLVSGVVIARNNSFESAVLLRNQTYEVAFAIRQAQQLAVSGAQTTANVRPMGIYVTSIDGQNQLVTTFRDANNNRRYDVGEEISTMRLDRRFYIFDITGGDNVAITFLRPNYDATFMRGGTSVVGPVEIIIRRVGSANAERKVTVTSAGQVSVE